MTVGKGSGGGSRLPREIWAELRGLGRERRFRAGGLMLRQGEPGTHVLALTEGLVKVVRSQEDGEATHLAFRGPGDLLGEVAVFVDEGERTADVIALRPCRAVATTRSTRRALRTACARRPSYRP